MMADDHREQEKSLVEKQDLYETANQRDGSVRNRARNTAEKTLLFVNEESGQRWLEEKSNGSLWHDEAQLFASANEANEKGWKVDAVKLVFKCPTKKDIESFSKRG